METIKVQIQDLSKGRTPILSYCRKLVADGVDPDTRVEFYRNNSEPDVIVTNLGETAKLTVLENAEVGPVFRTLRQGVTSPSRIHLNT